MTYPETHSQQAAQQTWSPGQSDADACVWPEEQGSNHRKAPWEKQPSRWKGTGEGRGNEGDQLPLRELGALDGRRNWEAMEQDSGQQMVGGLRERQACTWLGQLSKKMGLLLQIQLGRSQNFSDSNVKAVNNACMDHQNYSCCTRTPLLGVKLSSCNDYQLSVCKSVLTELLLLIIRQRSLGLSQPAHPIEHFLLSWLRKEGSQAPALRT